MRPPRSPPPGPSRRSPESASQRPVPTRWRKPRRLPPRRRRLLPHRPDLDGAERGERMPRSDLDRLVQMRTLDHDETADQVLCLRVRPIRHECLTTSYLHLRRGGGPEPGAALEHATRLYVGEPGLVLRPRVDLPRRLRVLLTVPDHQCVLHLRRASSTRP